MVLRLTVPSMRKSPSRRAFAAAVLVTALWQPRFVIAGGDQNDGFYLHCPVPLGVDAVRLESLKKTVYVMASVENQTLDGLHVVRAAHVGHVVRIDGSEVKTYPNALNFRVTASVLANDLQGIVPYTVSNQQGLNEFLLGWKFKLKIFRALKMTVIEPVNVKLIGVPAYEASRERVYRVNFETPNLPVDARLVLEVFDASGNRLTRFHLEML